jgi:hypothetical protein
MSQPVLDIIRGQIAAAEPALRAYRPTTVDWPGRAAQTAESLVPWLGGVAGDLKAHVEDVLNAPTRIRELWKSLRAGCAASPDQLLAFDRLLVLDDVLRESVTGEVVSGVVGKFLLDRNADLRSNGRSDYPDLYRASLDYSAVPAFTRKGTEEFGAALKGRDRRPVRVPDGLEIKSCRVRVAVDCHYPHAGLHLVLLFTGRTGAYVVTDIRVAFLSLGDYRRSNESTEATTRKFSFDGTRFVSILYPPQS